MFTTMVKWISMLISSKHKAQLRLPWMPLISCSSKSIWQIKILNIWHEMKRVKRLLILHMRIMDITHFCANTLSRRWDVLTCWWHSRKKSKGQQSLYESSSGDHECLYQVIEWLLRYFSLEQSCGPPDRPKMHLSRHAASVAQYLFTRTKI